MRQCTKYVSTVCFLLRQSLRTLATGAWSPKIGHAEGIARLVEWAKVEFEKNRG